MRRARPLRCSLPFVGAATLLLALGCAEKTLPLRDSGTGDWGSARDGGAGRDYRIGKIGSNCKPVGTRVVHQEASGRAGWMPRLAWSEGVYGIAWAQDLANGGQYATQPMLALFDAEGEPVGKPLALTEKGTANPADPVGIAGVPDGFAVVWADRRQSGDKRALVLARVNAKGQRLAGTAPCTAPGCGEVHLLSAMYASSPHLVRPGFLGLEGRAKTTSLAVTWRDGRNVKPPTFPGGPEEGRYDVFMKVVKLDGTQVLPEQRITTDTSRPHPATPVSSFDGTKYAMVWRDLADLGASELFFALVAADGRVLTEEKTLAVNRGLAASAPDLVWAGPEFGVAYSDNPDKDNGSIRFARVTRAGELLASQTVTTFGNPCTPTVAFNGERYAVAWQDRCGADGSKLVFALIDDGGKPLLPDGKSCLTSESPDCGLVTVSTEKDGTAAYPNMISVGGKFALTWMNAPKRLIQFTHIVCTTR
ncbi:MAG: hypothetical protein IT371_28475 [Deltaproteobacteria bacterium]|nr:hypothetical protein [Deltaproteobacteria bacterium]